jgi:phosphoribosylformylglycinamidine synthase
VAHFSITGMKFGVIIFPGSNCDHDLLHVFGTVLGQEVEELWHKQDQLDDYNPATDTVLVPGGFSYGDYLRAGALARFSPIMKAVIDFAGRGGRVIGICNGFQILCEAELLPGALLRNEHQKFICRNVYLRPQTLNSDLTNGLEADKAYNIPIAHAEGRYYASDAVLDELEANDQVLFRYCDVAGNVTPEANPNGSSRNIAGVCNPGRNVFGMMPHPERAAEDLLGNTDGYAILASLLKQAQVA